MKVIADLQIHSRFARAVSPQMVIGVISEWAAKKGIGLVATGDWTHPLWYRELRANLEDTGKGVYKYKNFQSANYNFETEPLFLLSTEISSIYSQGGKTRRIHNLIFAPDLETVEKINKELTSRGANLLSDGRPIVGLSAKVVAEIALGINKNCLIIPAHAWTPHFSIFGSQSGFDSIEECFGNLSSDIFAIETGLSSDPAMNWRIGELDSRQIVSFSDAHSPIKLGRESTVFELSEISFENLRKAIVGDEKEKIAYTIEFYPEEGKYHYTGHRDCKIVYSPNETRKMGTVCPVCGRALTIGVMSRVEYLATHDIEIKSDIDKFGVRWIREKNDTRPPYIMLVPLIEILSEALGFGVGSKVVETTYNELVSNFGGEFKVLTETSLEKIERVAGSVVKEAISRVRRGDIVIEPGYDGVFGKVKIWSFDFALGKSTQDKKDALQNTLF